VGGYIDRHSFLLGYPIGVIVVAVIRILFSTAHQTVSRAGFALFMLLMVAFGLSLNQSYIEWFSRSIYGASIQTNLARIDEASDFSMYWVETTPLDLQPHGLIFSEWTSLFKAAWGGETRLALHQDRETLDAFLAERGYQLTGQRVASNVDTEGCQALLTTQIGFSSYQDISGRNSRSELILRYLYHKFVLGPEATEQFLLTLTDVWIEPIAAPEATNCTTTARERQQQAVAIYDQILDFKPQWADAYYRRGRAYLALGQPDQAEADFTRAIELQPTFASAYYERGLSYAARGDDARARADYQQVLALSTDESLLRLAEEQLAQMTPIGEAGRVQP
jgi:tetratricopeptide (TPR) repeat protein